MSKSIPLWRKDSISEAVDAISMLPSALICLKPQINDSDEVRRTKQEIKRFISLNINLQVEKIRVAINDRAQKDPSHRPYLPAEEES